MSDNARYLMSLIQSERARVRRRTIRSVATPVPRADQAPIDEEVGLGSVPVIVEQKPWPRPPAFIGGVPVQVDLSSQTIIHDWPAEDTGELTTIGRQKPSGPGALGISLGFWNSL